MKLRLLQEVAAVGRAQTRTDHRAVAYQRERDLAAGRAEAHQRTIFMQQFLDQLKRELDF